MRDLSNIQILAGITLAFATGALVMDVTFGRLDRIRRHQAEERAARLQKRLDRIEAERALEAAKLALEDVSEEIGAKLVPVLTSMGEGLVSALDAWDGLSDGTQNFILVLARVAAAARLLHERAQRLFTYAADLARAEGAPAQTPEAEQAFELCPGCDGPLDGDLFHDDDPNGRPYCAACCPKCIADRAYMDARRAQKDATDA